MVGDPSGPLIPNEPEAPRGAGTRRVLLGELLVQSKVITAEQLGEVLGSPREAGTKLGQLLLDRGWITEAQLTQTLSLQLSVPWVSLYHIDFSRQLLNRLSRELADKYCLIPIFVRHVKGQGETLYVAMDDPTNEEALQEVTRQAGLPTRPMIASATDIRSAIRVYYGELPAGAPALDVPPPPVRGGGPATSRTPDAMPTPAVAEPEPPRAAAPPASRRAPSVPPPTSEQMRAARRSEPPGPPASTQEPPRSAGGGNASKRRPRMVNLTLLDGTTISLPAKKAETGPADSLTARDFVSALRATAHGADAREILGNDVRWEPVVAALLSILLRKGLIADWEFVEELRKV